MEKIYIAIKHNEREDVIQYADSIEQAKMLIEKVLPPLRGGYNYIIKE